MNLYLSSFWLGDHADLLLDMAGGPGARMAIITNAIQNAITIDLFSPAGLETLWANRRRRQFVLP